jgi:HD-GYP domain-containing protein (c-di-GMP phosphodiesterase class II)
MTVEEALREIKRCVDTQFDPVAARAFLKISASLPTIKGSQATASKTSKTRRAR